MGRGSRGQCVCFVQLCCCRVVAAPLWRNREQPIRFVAAKFPTETTFDDASDGKEAKINRKRNRNEKRRQDRLIHYLFEVWIKSNSTQN